MGALQIEVPDVLVEQIARRVAELITRGPEGWLDVEGAARHLSCPVSRVYDLCTKGETGFPVHKDGSRSYFKASELDAWRTAGRETNGAI